MAPVTNTNPPDPATPVAPQTAPARQADAPRPKPPGRSRWSGCLPWLLLFAVLLGGLTIWKYPAFKAQAELGSAYAARIGCSCRYVQGRSLESCQSDFEPGMEMVSVSEDPATRTITGSVPLLASRSARYAGASGCLLLPAE